MKKIRRSQEAVLPTPGELRLLRILWRIGEGSIEDILKAADESPAPNYKTVQTLLRIMERSGFGEVLVSEHDILDGIAWSLIPDTPR